MEDLSLHILDIVENSIAAGASRVEIRVQEGRRDDRLSIEIADDGCGMREETLARATDPFFTSRTTRRVGLGLSLFEQAARRAGGDFKITSRPGVGTQVTGVFQHNHVDRQPLGDIAQTLLTLVVGNPQVEFSYVHQTGDSSISFSTREITARLGGIPLHSPRGIAAVRQSAEKLRKQLKDLASREEGVHAVGNR